MRKRKSFVVLDFAFLRLKSCSAYKVSHRCKVLLSNLSSFENYDDIKNLKSVIRALTVKSHVWTKFVQTSDFTVKALITLNSLKF